MLSYYHNEILFSEIYLEEITQIPEEAEVLASLNVLSQYRQYADTSSLLSWQTSYVNEVLSALGFHAQSKTDHLVNLFPLGISGEGQPVSVCYVVSSSENLNNTTIGRNWAEKIIRALRENNLSWGLLTNGNQWRIYHQDEPTPYETYLEIDLEGILNDKAKGAYQIFHKFMKAENFAIQEDGKCQFDRFKKESQDKIDYIEKELANALKQREEGGKGVLSDLCMGYVEELRHRNEGNLDDEDLRKKIYHGAMLYMFRLLFLFYADARGLLSDENHDLLANVEGECRTRHDGNSPNDLSFHIWDSLEYIFVDIDQTYNGGLFSPQESEFTRFISDTRIGDNYLANAIFNLTTYLEKDGQEIPISYRDMSVRHLGTLYEGLLEHKLFIAKEDTEVKVANSKILFIPVSMGGKLMVGHYIKKGDVYFAGDPSERKSTGSYYTPEYIVDYIVRETVGMKLHELEEDFLLEEKVTIDAYINAIDITEKESIAGLLEESTLEFVHRKVLKLSIVDPAMGSGHFLVNATNQISNFITHISNQLEFQGNLPTGTDYWRRWVVENCIYGVDINPLAVELTKLSLWILAMAKNHPLSFLNHHIKSGNSIAGTRINEIGIYPLKEVESNKKQYSIFENNEDFGESLNVIIGKINEIEAISSDSIEILADKKIKLEEIFKISDSYKKFFNFQMNVIKENMTYWEYQEIIQGKSHMTKQLGENQDNYFHWELEYPEVLLFSQGFDVVVTNPPYLGESGNKEIFSPVKRGALRKYYIGKMDILYFFFHLALSITKPNSLISLITTNYLITANGAKLLREDLKQRSIIKSIINFNDLKIFGSALGQHSMISILQRGHNPTDMGQTINFQRSGLADLELFNSIMNGRDDNTQIKWVSQNELFEGDENYIRFKSVDLIQGILEKIAMGEISLGKACQVAQGVVTGGNKVRSEVIQKYKLSANIGDGIFILSQDEVNRLHLTQEELSIIKPWYKNSDIKKWFVNLTPKGFLININYSDRPDMSLYPNLYAHFSKYRTVLENRPQTGTLQSAFKNGYWYVLTTSRKLNFSGPKIVVPQRSPSNNFGYTELPWFAASDVYFITAKDQKYPLKFLLGLLNSKLFYFWLYFRGKRKGEILELFGTPLSEIPIRIVEKNKQEEIISLVNMILDYGPNSGSTNIERVKLIEKELNNKVYELYKLDPSEINLVESIAK